MSCNVCSESAVRVAESVLAASVERCPSLLRLPKTAEEKGSGLQNLTLGLLDEGKYARE
jgi:hypothetical protein